MKQHWLLTRHSRVELYVPNLIGDPCPQSQSLFSLPVHPSCACYVHLVCAAVVQAMSVWRAPCEPLRWLSLGLWSASLGTSLGAVTSLPSLNSNNCK